MLFSGTLETPPTRLGAAHDALRAALAGPRGTLAYGAAHWLIARLAA